MSGQRAKPKYRSVHLPSKVRLVTRLPSRSTSDQSPPIAGLPAGKDGEHREGGNGSGGGGREKIRKCETSTWVTSICSPQIRGVPRYPLTLACGGERRLTAPECILDREPSPLRLLVFSPGEEFRIRTPARLTRYLCKDISVMCKRNTQGTRGRGEQIIQYRTTSTREIADSPHDLYH